MMKYVTVEEVAQHLRCSIPTVYRYVSNRTLPYFKQGHRVLFDLEEIDNWMQKFRIEVIKSN